MSSLWTPGGERPVGRDTGDDHPQQPGPASPDDLTDAEREELEQELAAMQRQLLENPASVVIANHAIGLFQLASLHLSQRPPQVEEGRLAIDAMAAIIEGLGTRLGDQEAPLREALSRLRLAFVELSKRVEGGGEGGEKAGDGET